MSTSVWPTIPPDELKEKEEESLARELAWLLESLQETLESLKSGLEDCYALLAPTEPGSTLVVSSLRSESIKGHITRVGTRVVKGSLHLRLRTQAPIHLVLNPEVPIVLSPLVNLRALLNQSLDCVDITRWTGDRNSAIFISSQLRLLHSIIDEARQTLKGLSLPSPSDNWTIEPIDPSSFNPPLPDSIGLSLSIQEAGIVVSVRSLEPSDATPDLKSMFALAIGVQRRLEHDEAEQVFEYRGKDVRVREKVRVESADPSLMSTMAKLAALEHNISMARKCLSIVMGEDLEDLP